MRPTRERVRHCIVKIIAFDPQDRSKRSLSETRYWDAPKSSLNEWFSSDNCDYKLVAKSAIISLACIAGLGIVVVFMFAYRKYNINRTGDFDYCDDYADTETDKLCHSPWSERNGAKAAADNDDDNYCSRTIVNSDSVPKRDALLLLSIRSSAVYRITQRFV